MVIFGVISSIFCFVQPEYLEERSKKYHKEYLQTKDTYYLDRSKDYKNEAYMLRATGFIGVPALAYIIYLLSNILFFNILKRHSQWISSYGLFTDYKGEKSFIEKTTEKIQTIKKEPLNTTDELLKWAELKEKGLITDEEFQKAKEKILEGKL